MTEHGKLFTPIYELKRLSGISFDIIPVEDIITPDGTIRYKGGTVIDTVTTKADGTATSKPLYLGKYQAVEKNTLDGFVLDTEKHPFELVYQDQNTELVTTAIRVENQRQKAKVSLVKEAEMLCSQTSTPFSSILFGTYAKEDILTASGEVGIEQGSLIDVFTVDDLGNGTMNTDIPAGSYYIKELVTGDGYLLSQEEYPFTFSYMGQKEPLIRIHLNDGKPVENKLMRGAIEINKTSEDKKLEGISFKIKGKTVVGTEYENTFQTDKDGKIFIDNLPIGEYAISEVLDDKTVGYIKPENETVKVKNDSTLIVEFENILQRGGIKIVKSAEGEADLAGFAFEVTGTSLNGTKYKEAFKTDKDGIIEVKKLLVGDYTIREIANEKAKGYILPKDQKTTVEHGKTSIVKVENKKEKEVVTMKNPKTGDTGNLLGVYVLLGGSAVALAVTYFLKKRKAKKS